MDYQGYRQRFKFDNGYAASVVSFWGSYGGNEGLFELAVFHDGQLVYDTPITKDVEGRLTFREVADLLDKVKALPPREPEETT
jgi:hypothetical protein